MTDLNAWEAELDRFEARLTTAERLLAPATAVDVELLEECVGTPPWKAPTHLGPIPDALVPRARALLERQRETSAGLVEAMRAINRQRGFASKVSDATTNRSRPVYLDVQA